MINCSRCGALCGEGEHFCRNCGAPLMQVPENTVPDAEGYRGTEGYGGPGGANGYDSINGYDSANGYNGANGYTGAYNTNGYDGMNRQGGYGGAFGQQGAYGQQGPYGQQGAYGQQGPYGQAGQYGQRGPYGYAPYAPYPLNTTGIKKRNIALAIIFSIITLGIYSIYWMIKMNNEINQLADEPNATSGGLVFLFSLITCGIYSIYWLYRMGQRSDKIKGSTSSEILYLILGIFGLSIIAYALIQDTINNAVGA